MRLTFPIAHVRALVQASKEATHRRPSSDDMFNPSCWRDDMTEDRQRELLTAIVDDNYGSLSKWPTEEEIDPAKVPASVWLVGDEGVYLMSNAPFAETKTALEAQGLKHVCYADQCNPDTMDPDVVRDSKIKSFGPDDGVVTIDVAGLEPGLNGEKLILEVTPEGIGLVYDDPAQKPSTPSSTDEGPGM